jgi:methoxymalonate biosynthesis acyl carrier protein
MSAEIADRIRSFVFDATQLRVDDDDALLAGIVDSRFLLQVLAFVEGEFGVELDDEDLIADNFSSLAAIAALVEKALSSDGT